MFPRAVVEEKRGSKAATTMLGTMWVVWSGVPIQRGRYERKRTFKAVGGQRSALSSHPTHPFLAMCQCGFRAGGRSYGHKLRVGRGEMAFADTQSHTHQASCRGTPEGSRGPVRIQCGDVRGNRDAQPSHPSWRGVGPLVGWGGQCRSSETRRRTHKCGRT